MHALGSSVGGSQYTAVFFFVKVDAGIACEQFSFCILVFMDDTLTDIFNL